MNWNLDAATFNAVLHECADLATSEDSVALAFADGAPAGPGGDLPLAHVREVRLAPSAHRAPDPPPAPAVALVPPPAPAVALV